MNTYASPVGVFGFSFGSAFRIDDTGSIVSRRRTPGPGRRTVCERILSAVVARVDVVNDEPGGPPLVLVFNIKCWLLFAVDVSILDDVIRELFTPWLVVPLIAEWSLIIGGIAAVIGRCCLSIDGRFSLSIVVDGRVLDETIFGANVDGLLEASVTPLLVVAFNWPSEFVSF